MNNSQSENNIQDTDSRSVAKRDLSYQREQFAKGKLRRNQLADCPIEQFGRWYADAERMSGHYPNPVCLSTVDTQGQPVSRIVLIKGFDESGFYFYSNYQSRKGHHLDNNPKVSMCFYWEELERQVIIQGIVKKTDHDQSDRYFATRPRGSQLGAHLSQQSITLESRKELEQGLEQLEQKYNGIAVPRPDHWGGYLVKPFAIEFWQGQDNRLHDRFIYQKATTAWTIQRLAP